MCSQDRLLADRSRQGMMAHGVLASYQSQTTAKPRHLLPGRRVNVECTEDEQLVEEECSPSVPNISRQISCLRHSSSPCSS